MAAGGLASWNVYRGDLSALVTLGEYAQLPGSNPLALQSCSQGANFMLDADTPAAGQVAFYLISGMLGGAESSIGQDSAGVERANVNSCP